MSVCEWSEGWFSWIVSFKKVSRCNRSKDTCSVSIRGSYTVWSIDRSQIICSVSTRGSDATLTWNWVWTRLSSFLGVVFGDGWGGWVSGGDTGSCWIRITCSSSFYIDKLFSSKVEHVWLVSRSWGDKVWIRMTWMGLIKTNERVTVLRQIWALNPTSSYFESELEEVFPFKHDI